MEFNPSGQVKTRDQIKDERDRNGLCTTCRVDPIRCYDVRKKYGGLKIERNPLTVQGKVFNGVCLKCHPSADPDAGKGGSRRVSHHRSHRLHHNHDSQEHDPEERLSSSDANLPINSLEVEDDNFVMRSTSYPGDGRRSSQMHRQSAIRNLSATESLDLPSPANGGFHFGVGSSAAVAPAEIDQRESSITTNIFGNPLPEDKEKKEKKEKKKKKKKRHSEKGHARPADGETNRRASADYSRPHKHHHARHTLHHSVSDGGRHAPHHNDFQPPNERVTRRRSPEADGMDAPPSPQTPQRRATAMETRQSPIDRSPPISRRRHLHTSAPGSPNSPPPLQTADHFEDAKMPSIPNFSANQTENVQQESKNVSNLGDAQDMDELAKIIAEACAKNPELIQRFVPGATFLPNSELVLDDSTVVSEMTMDTFIKSKSGRNFMNTINESSRNLESNSNDSSVPRHWAYGEQLDAISEATSVVSSPATEADQQSNVLSGARSVASHQIHSPPTPPNEMVSDQNNLESEATDLIALRDLVAELTATGADEMIIDVVTQALVQDNYTDKSEELALFCLTSLWVLARRSDENKRKIIFEECTFEVIIEAMEIYCNSSADIQTRGCGIIWTLSMDPNDRKSVAELGGCSSVLKAMVGHLNLESVQVMAMGALKVLACDPTGKARLLQENASSIVADSMARHIANENIQSEGCAILCNLTMESNQFVQIASKKEVSSIVNALLAHPNSLEVNDSACFTLLSLACSSANLDTIRQNEMSRHALELAAQKHPETVGRDVQTLLERLHFEPSAFHEGQVLPI